MKKNKFKQQFLPKKHSQKEIIEKQRSAIRKLTKENKRLKSELISLERDFLRNIQRIEDLTNGNIEELLKELNEKED